MRSYYPVRLNQVWISEAIFRVWSGWERPPIGPTEDEGRSSHTYWASERNLQGGWLCHLRGIRVPAMACTDVRWLALSLNVSIALDCSWCFLSWTRSKLKPKPRSKSWYTCKHLTSRKKKDQLAFDFFFEEKVWQLVSTMDHFDIAKVSQSLRESLI